MKKLLKFLGILVLVVVLVVKPTGLLGKPMQEKV